MNPKIDRFLNHARTWQEEMRALREIILECGLSEELKWRLPCYISEEKNIVIIQSFKEYCALMFFKGALLKDPKKLLKVPGSSQAIRQIQFTDVQEVQKLRPVIKSYVKEAIKLEKAGIKVEFKKAEEFDIPLEFVKKMKEMPKLKSAFKALTPGRQRAYLLYFSAAKQPKTREARVEKYTQRILNGKGLND